MTSERLNKFLRNVVCAPIALAAAAAFVSMPASAQDDQPAWLDVAIVQIKPGHAPDFEPLVRELMQALQAAGRPTPQVFEVVIGRPGEYHLVTPVASIAANEMAGPPMEQAQMAVWMQRVTQHIDSVRFFYARLHPEHGIQTDAGGSAEIMVLQTIRTVSGMQNEYAEWVADYLVPALRETDIAGHTLSSGAFGDSSQNFYHAMPVSGWDYLDMQGPLQRSMGQAAYDRMIDRVDGIVESNSSVVARMRGDLQP